MSGAIGHPSGSDAAEVVAQDERARREALDPSRSLLLQAPAGSGKTTVLTARFLTLLTQVDEPEQIIAITFTRKAAAEMRHRILGALHSPAGGSAAAGLSPELIERVRRRDRQLAWKLQENPARLRIQTVDALNHGFAQVLPVAGRTAPALQISDAPTELYRLAARRCLQRAWTDPALRGAALLLFARLDNVWAQLERLVAQMLAKRSHWLARLLRAGREELGLWMRQSLEALLQAELAQVKARLPAEVLEEGRQLIDHAARVRLSADDDPQASQSTMGRALGAEAVDLPRWRALANLALTKQGSWRRTFSRTDGFAPEEPLMKQRALAWVATLSGVPQADSLLQAVRDLPAERLTQADEAALDALALLLRYAAAELKLVFAERGRADHTEMAAAARACLTEQGEPSEQALRAGGAVRHILVDEFQDTSLEQFEMLRVLTAGWSAGDGRTLFLVGDPMQSIYQFREAEVGLFLRARDRGLGELQFEALQLRRNFRASAALIDWVNENFSRLFPAEDDARLAAIRYLHSVPAQSAAAPVRAVGVTADLFARHNDASGEPASPAVTLHRFEHRDVTAEAQRVLEIVRAAREDVREPSIAVLVASREHAAAIAALLRDAHVPLRAVDLEPLRDRPVIRDLAALTRALLHPADRTAWLALLRAPWCGLTLAQLESLCGPDEVDGYAALQAQMAAMPASAAPRPAIRRVLRALAPALEGAERALPLWQRVERCWLRLAGPAVHAREADRLDAWRFIDALAMHDSPEALVGEALSELTDGLHSTAPAQAGAVEIMTMHAAKGLEWDVVLLPGLGRSIARDREPLLHWIDLPRAEGSGTDLLLCPMRATGDEAPGSLAEFIQRIRRRRARIERVRLLYVAATRARHSLHLLGWLQPASQPAQLPRPFAGSPLELLWPQIGAQFLATPVPAAGMHGQVVAASTPRARIPEGLADRSAHGPALKRLPWDWTVPLPTEAPALVSLSPDTARERIAPEYWWVGATARAVGTIVHAELHRLSLSASIAEADRLLSRLPDYRLWLTELGVPDAELAQARQRIERALKRTLQDPRGRWLIGGGHIEARSEWRLTGMHEQRIVNVVFDRMLLDEHGQRWVVDFKTGVHEGAGQEPFIESELQRYRAQLQRYAALARSLGPQPVRVALYFPLLGVFRELALDA